jgi:hypothetical protein
VTKTSSAPKNFYTAAQAAKRLGMPRNTFFTHVRNGKIKKVVFPGQTEGFYPRKDIDRMAREKELFILEYAAEPSIFAGATEEDIKGIYDLCVNLFGVTGTTDYETMLSWQQKNPYTYYVVKQEDIVTGYIGFLYLNKETTESIMSASTPGRPRPPATEVLPFIPNTPIEGLWIGLGVRPGLSTKQARYHARHLLTGAMETLEDLARQGMSVKKLYATSQTSDGIELSRKLGFREIAYPNEPLIRFELDLETSKNPLLEEYQKIIRTRKQQTA